MLLSEVKNVTFKNTNENRRELLRNMCHSIDGDKYFMQSTKYDDMALLSTFEKPKFKFSSKTPKEIKDALNTALDKCLNSRIYKQCLFTVSLRTDDDDYFNKGVANKYWFTVNAHAISSNDKTYASMQHIDFDEENANEVIKLSFEYAMKNPIIFAIDHIDQKFLNDKYIQTLISKSINDFAELKLLCDVASI